LIKPCKKSQNFHGAKFWFECATKCKILLWKCDKSEIKSAKYTKRKCEICVALVITLISLVNKQKRNW